MDGKSVSNFDELVQRTKVVFDKHPVLNNHLDQYPWLQGTLGDPFAGIWFMAENPSLTMVERADHAGGGAASPDAQWNTSRGDLIFRQALFLAGLKNTPIGKPGGWNCYITNIIKEADYAKNWGSKSPEAKQRAADIWFEVLQLELETTQPKQVVTLGNQTDMLFDYIKRKRRISIPHKKINHYAYIGQRPDSARRLPAGDPIRVKEYQDEIKAIADAFVRLSK